jgi:DNA-binding GntR family transcriptional regulator
VHQKLRARISAGEFPAGSTIPVSDLWKEYRVPPIIVTVAIKHLVAQGVVVWPHMKAPVVQQSEGAAP